jgi:hypothetical protein
MTNSHIWLDDWEHQCCGDRRAVGDRIVATVAMGTSLYWELRHEGGLDPNGERQYDEIRGVVTEILYHQGVMQKIGERSWRPVGFLPGVQIDNTDDVGDFDHWSLEFIVDVDENLNDLGMGFHDGSPRRGSKIMIGFFVTGAEYGDDEPEGFWFGYEDSVDYIHLEVSPKFSNAKEAISWWSVFTDRIVVGLGTENEKYWVGSDHSSNPGLPLYDDGDVRSTVAGAREASLRCRDQWLVNTAIAKAEILQDDGREIKRRRQILGLSVSQLSERSDVSRLVIENLERGYEDPSVSMTTWVNLVWALTEPWPAMHDRARSAENKSMLLPSGPSALRFADAVVGNFSEQ